MRRILWILILGSGVVFGYGSALGYGPRGTGTCWHGEGPAPAAPAPSE